MIDPDHTWQDVALALIAISPSLIAAISSLRNGQEQRRVRKELHKLQSQHGQETSEKNGLQPR